jgi:threonyl-tRNA synthetase
MQKKIRNAQLQQVPYILVVGDAEEAAGTAAVRLRSGTNLGALSLDTLLDRLRREIKDRRDLAEA